MIFFYYLDVDAGCRSPLQDKLKVAIASHPSLLKVPDDLEAVKKHSVPFLWNTCETDNMVSSCSGSLMLSTASS